MNKKEIDLCAMPTPNPNAIKFVVNMTLVEFGSFTFTKKLNSQHCLLAAEILQDNQILEVMIGKNFISINKDEKCGWENVLEKASNTIKNFLVNHTFSIDQELLDSQKNLESSNDDIVKINQILDDEIRPAINMDGGDCHFHSYEDGILTLELKGACSSCPSATMTLKMGIEARLKEEIPSLIEVVQI